MKKVVTSEKEANKAREELEQSEQRYEIAVNSSNTGLWNWEKNTDLFYTSELFKQMLGYTKEEFPNSLAGFLNLVHPDDRAQMTDIFSNADFNQQNINLQYRIKTKSGEYGWYQTIGQVVKDHFNKSKSLAGSLLDINERKKVESMKNEFISIVSHELRTPLTSIRGGLSLLLSGKLGDFPAKAKSLLEIANSNCERLINLINDILDVEKIEAGKMVMNLQPLQISQIIKDAIAGTQMYAEKLDVKIELVKDLPDVIVMVDYEKLIQVINNLLSNAMKFSPPKQTVNVSIIKFDNKVRVEVSDKGPGITDKFKNSIFQKFSQADSTTTRKVSGTGLGLSISKAIIENMEGTIGFYNNNSIGATFYFELPCLNC